MAKFVKIGERYINMDVVADVHQWQRGVTLRYAVAEDETNGVTEVGYATLTSMELTGHDALCLLAWLNQNSDDAAALLELQNIIGGMTG